MAEALIAALDESGDARPAPENECSDKESGARLGLGGAGEKNGGPSEPEAVLRGRLSEIRPSSRPRHTSCERRRHVTAMVLTCGTTWSWRPGPAGVAGRHFPPVETQLCTSLARRRENVPLLGGASWAIPTSPDDPIPAPVGRQPPRCHRPGVPRRLSLATAQIPSGYARLDAREGLVSLRGERVPAVVQLPAEVRSRLG